MLCYRGSLPARLWCRLAPAGLALTLALAGGGCSLSYQLDSMARGGSDSGAEYSGAVRRTLSPAASLSATNDLAVARAAISEALASNGKDTSVPWENPTTGARGTITPLASAYSEEDGRTCRDFLASYVRDGNESWLQGEACRGYHGRWEVRQMKPWRRT